MNTNNYRTWLVEVAEGDFEVEVLGAKQPVLVAFCTPRSPRCQVIDAVLREIAAAWEREAKVVKVNTDDSLDLSIWYNIESVPTVLLFVDGKPCARIVGTASKEALLAKLNHFGVNV